MEANDPGDNEDNQNNQDSDTDYGDRYYNSNQSIPLYCIFSLPHCLLYCTFHFLDSSPIVEDQKFNTPLQVYFVHLIIENFAV